MQRFLILIIILAMLCTPLPVSANSAGLFGGVNDEYQYEEIVFLSGEPIKFVGTFSISEKEREDSASLSCKFDLKPEDKTIEGELSRKITYTIDYDRRMDKGQTIADMSVASYRETIEIGDDKYSLKDYQFSRSDVIDNRPASDFYSSTIKARKYYLINKDEGTATVDISGGSVGYENFWGSTDTGINDMVIKVERDVPPEGDAEKDDEPKHTDWQGTVRVNTSDSMRKTLNYEKNPASLSSFNGSHMRITNHELYAGYEYDLPQFSEGIASTSRRNRGNIELSKEMLPRIERLIIPKFRDIGGHWAEDDIRKLYSLDVFTGSNQFFAPDVPMTRADFTIAIIKACDIRTMQEGKTVKRRSKEVEVSPFRDVAVSSPSYQYVKDAVNKGIISGVTADLFMPEDDLTRAQAITILIRALGFENQAPTPGYFTSFNDDYEIPGWAKDSIYMAKEIGLVSGDTGNQINPNKVMTRAEASAMLVRFLNFLERDLQRDYREDIVLYN